MSSKTGSGSGKDKIQELLDALPKPTPEQLAKLDKYGDFIGEPNTEPPDPPTKPHTETGESTRKPASHEFSTTAPETTSTP